MHSEQQLFICKAVLGEVAQGKGDSDRIFLSLLLKQGDAEASRLYEEKQKAQYALDVYIFHKASMMREDLEKSPASSEG